MCVTPRLGVAPNSMNTASTPVGLKYVVWELTLKCDLACGHCGSRAGKPREDELSTQEALGVVRQLAALGAGEVTLIGGEAYLRDDFDTIARAIVAAGMRCGMTSGGKNITAERAHRLAAAGVSSVSVSFDGMRKTHDLQRGVQGSFDAAARSLTALKEAGIRISANTQVNRLSFPELGEVYSFLLAAGVTDWQVQLTVPMGRAADHPDWLLQPYDLLEVYPRLAELAERGAREGLVFWPANNIGYFGPHERVLRGRGLHADRAWGGCVAGKHALGLESDGTVKGCPSLPTRAYGAGNTRRTPIRQLWEEERSLRFMRDGTIELWGECASCYYADVCRGGCTWTAHVFFGKPGNNPYCHHRALEMDARGLRERLVLRSPAPGTPFDHGVFEAILEPKHAPVSPTVRRLPIL
jgi:radical SAM protein with 4Fe4S-binding SPASM domain